MVELDSYSSVDWPDSAVSHDKTEALKSKSPKAKLVGDRYLNIKRGVCPLDWAMGQPLAILRLHQNRQIAVPRIVGYYRCYLRRYFYCYG
jgi:hypothetical protein